MSLVRVNNSPPLLNTTPVKRCLPYLFTRTYLRPNKAPSSWPPRTSPTPRFLLHLSMIDIRHKCADVWKESGDFYRVTGSSECLPLVKSLQSIQQCLFGMHPCVFHLVWRLFGGNPKGNKAVCDTKMVIWDEPTSTDNHRKHFGPHLDWIEHSVPTFVFAAARGMSNIHSLSYIFFTFWLCFGVCLCLCSWHETAMTQSWRPKMWSPEVPTVVAVKLQSLSHSYKHTFTPSGTFLLWGSGVQTCKIFNRFWHLPFLHPSLCLEKDISHTMRERLDRVHAAFTGKSLLHELGLTQTDTQTHTHSNLRNEAYSLGRHEVGYCCWSFYHSIL